MIDFRFYRNVGEVGETEVWNRARGLNLELLSSLVVKNIGKNGKVRV